jgi:hypothetical protein
MMPMRTLLPTRSTAVLLEERLRPRVDAGCSRGGGVTGQCPQWARAQRSASSAAGARRPTRADDQWLTIADRKGLGIPESQGGHRSGALRTHGGPRGRAPPRSRLQELCLALRPESASVAPGLIRCQVRQGAFRQRQTGSETAGGRSVLMLFGPGGELPPRHFDYGKALRRIRNSMATTSGE